MDEPKFRSSKYLVAREGGLPDEYLLEGAPCEEKREYESLHNLPHHIPEYKKKHPEIINPYCRWTGEIVEMEMKDTVDTLEFRPFDPLAAEEDWAEEIMENLHGSKKAREIIGLTTQILVNGRDLNDYFGQMDKLGHTQADWLYMGLIRITEEIFQREGDVWELACCRGCGEPGCDYVGAAIWKDGDYVIWDCWYEYGDMTRMLFRFRYDEYLKAVGKLGSRLPAESEKRFKRLAGKDAGSERRCNG